MSAAEKGKEPRKIMDDKAIQIGVSKELGHYYVDAVTQIEDVTELAH